MNRCGTIAIAGRPNVGKSTLLNRLVGIKVSITAHKPQTTRHSVLGVRTHGDAQLIFVDTPGIHVDGKRVLNRVLNRTASTALLDVDAVVFMVQALSWTEDDQRALELVNRCGAPVFMLVNKTDRVADKPKLLPFLADLPRPENLREVIPVSAKTGQNVDILEKHLIDIVPQGEHRFDPDDFTDRSMRFLASELIREQLTRFLEKELPYSLSVGIEQFDIEEGLFRISGVIWVEKSSQKGIVIGKQGAMLKEIGRRSRESMEALFGTKVFLQLWVKVKDGWADDLRAIQSLGYEGSDD
ncbi:GTPase Era [Granulosicoccaceae sp. 1_MG-2023]|nr:GTPase Era [Granulosicoccaceae sp. 1_MG-2023]